VKTSAKSYEEEIGSIDDDDVRTMCAYLVRQLAMLVLALVLESVDLIHIACLVVSTIQERAVGIKPWRKHARSMDRHTAQGTIGTHIYRQRA
jgi:hypothetical protein